MYTTIFQSWHGPCLVQPPYRDNIRQENWSSIEVCISSTQTAHPKNNNIALSLSTFLQRRNKSVAAWITISGLTGCSLHTQQETICYIGNSVGMYLSCPGSAHHSMSTCLSDSHTHCSPPIMKLKMRRSRSGRRRRRCAGAEKHLGLGYSCSILAQTQRNVTQR